MKNDKKNSVDPINFLRIIAVSLVFILHTLISVKLTTGVRDYPFIIQTPAWAGVWIFIFLSGYLIGKGFINGKYEMSFKGVLKFYLKRFVKIVIPYYIFHLIVGVIVYQQYYYSNPSMVLNIFLLNFNGQIGIGGMGATWFVSTICKLYLIIPFVYLIFNKIISLFKRHKNIFVICIIVLLLGGGLLLRCNFLNNHSDWYSVVYTAFYSNLDIFIVGFLMNYLTDKKININKIWIIVLKISTIIILISLVVITSYCYYYGELYGKINLLIYYKYYFPTLYVIVCSLYIYVFSINKKEYTKLEISSVLHNPLRIIDCLSVLSFEFFMWHSMILVSLEKIIINKGFTDTYMEYLILTFIIANIFAYVFHQLNKSISEKILSKI